MTQDHEGSHDALTRRLETLLPALSPEVRLMVLNAIEACLRCGEATARLNRTG
jgi:hypothetical protein